MAAADEPAHANRSSCRCLRIARRRQCHDLVSVLQSFGEVVRSWSRNAVIIGPAETPFEDGTFRLVMHFEEQYPNKPPGVKFISQMFHPNVYGTGELCLDILQNRWSPTYDVAAILTSIQRYVRCSGRWNETDSYLVCSTTRIPRPRPTSKLRTSTKITEKNM